jgi:hypothetical protein
MSTVLGDGRREIHFQTDGCRIDEAHGDHWSTKDRDFELGGGICERFRDRQMSRYDHARDVLLAKLQAARLLFVGWQAFQIAYLRVAKDLNTFACEISEKA